MMFNENESAINSPTNPTLLCRVHILSQELLKSGLISPMKPFFILTLVVGMRKREKEMH